MERPLCPADLSALEGGGRCCCKMAAQRRSLLQSVSGTVPPLPVRASLSVCARRHPHLLLILLPGKGEVPAVRGGGCTLLPAAPGPARSPVWGFGALPEG